jgi:cytochrome c-type biogenesis protein CcmH
MRGELMAAVQRGDSDDLTLQAMVQNYGPTVIAAPTTTGFNRVAWIMPYLALVTGLGMMILLVRAWRNRPLKPTPANVPPVSGSELEHFRRQAREETEL